MLKLVFEDINFLKDYQNQKILGVVDSRNKKLTLLIEGKTTHTQSLMIDGYKTTIRARTNLKRIGWNG